MFDNRVITELKKVIGWKDHWDTTEIPALPASLTNTESGQYYQEYHPSVRLDYIQALLPSNYPLNTFLDDIETTAINQMLEKMVAQKKLNNAGMDLARNNLIYDNVEDAYKKFVNTIESWYPEHITSDEKEYAYKVIKQTKDGVVVVFTKKGRKQMQGEDRH